MKRYTLSLAVTVIALFGCADDSNDVEVSEDDIDEVTEETELEDVSEEDEEAVSAQDSELVMGVLATPNSLDPHAANEPSSNHVTVNIYEKLVRFTPESELEPELSESYRQIEDETWEFILREDVSFHDGEPFNAEAVKANLDRVRDEDIGSPVAFIFELIEEVEVVDEYTVHIHTSSPFAALPAHLAHTAGGMISPAVIEDDYEGEEPLTAVHQNPVGTGMYRFDELATGDFVRLVRNEDYWDTPAQAESFTFNAVPEDQARIAELQTGYADLIYPVDPNDYETIENGEDTTVNVTESVRMEYVGFNTTVEPFDDPDVRRAIHMAIDKDLILEEMLQNQGIVADTYLSPAVFGHSENLEGIEFDIEAAQELLAEAGYEDGFSAEITAMDRTAIDIATVLQSQLAELNIELEIYQQESGAFLEYVANGEHEMFIGGWGTVTLDADYGLYPLLHTSNIGSSGNRTGYSNEEVDDLLDAAREETDESRRLELYEEIQEIVIEESPLVPLYHPNLLTGLSDEVEGYAQHPASFHLLREVSK